MEIRSVKIKEIKPYDRNAKKHDDTQINNVAESIRQFDFVQPIVIDSNGVIVIGHCRFEAAKRLKYAEVPCIMVDDLTPEQVDALRIVDNKTNESPWDIDLLTEELQDLDLSMFDFAWDLMEETDEATEITEDEAPEVDKTNDPISKFGQIWKLGRHRLMCGDSTSEENVKALLGGAKADLLLTDPPYGVDYTGKTKDALKIQNDAKTDEEMIEFLSSAFRAADAVMKPGAVFYIWYAGTKEHAFDKACQLTGWEVRQILIWAKNTMVMGRQDYQWKHEPCIYGWKGGAGHLWASDRKQTTLLEFDRPTANKEHPTMKPIALFDYQIQNNTKGGDIVLDLFGGSGTTIIACEQNGRNACVMEYDPKYVDVIIKRWENFTGEKAVLEE
ncbi:MAG: ParB N-terminal domain-containing protein [Firmicutes bacterium]|nr:ParB N-terminal domain-containing protein [Bacillota bacterium]